MIKTLEGVVCHKFLWIEAAMEEVLLDQLENEDQAPNFQADQAVSAQDHEKLVSENLYFQEFFSNFNFYVKSIFAVSQEVEEDDSDIGQDSIGSRDSRSRFRSRSSQRLRPAASKVRPVTIELKPESVEELLKPSRETSRTSSFGSRKRNNFRTSSRNNNNRLNEFKLNRPAPSFSRNNDQNDDDDESTAPVAIKKFNRFKRPDIRQSLLQKILGKGKGKNTLDPEEQERLAEESKTQQLKGDDLNDDSNGGEIIEEVDYNGIDPINPLMTTLEASTIYPENREQTSTYLEVATIRSPYRYALLGLFFNGTVFHI